MAGPHTLSVTAALFLLAISILGFMFASITSQWTLIDERMAWVRHTQTVLQSLDGLEIALRGSVLAGREHLSAPTPAARREFEGNVARYHDQRDRLRRLVADNPTQQRLLDASAAAVDGKRRLWQTLLERRERSPEPEPPWLSAAMKDMTISDLMEQVYTMRALEFDLLAQRVAASEREILQGRYFVVIGLSICLTFLLATFALLWTEIGRRRQAEGLLRDLNDGLELLVEERTQELAAANLQLRGEIASREEAQAALVELNRDLERRVAERTRQLEASNQDLESFSYSVSHDLRAPLRAIIGFARMLDERLGPRLDAEERRPVQVIGDSARRMSALIDDLLAFARLGRAALQPQPVDMDALVREVVAELLPEDADEEDRRADIRWENLPPAVADAKLLRQVWLNLIGNAIKFTARAPQPRIVIRGERRDGLCRYEIRDNGAGFDMRFRDRLFGVFQRLHRADDFAGTGVGLAIVQRIVSRHGGTVDAEGEPGRGAVFGFTLPAEPAA